MIDSDKVMKGLEYCRSWYCRSGACSCPYWKEDKCMAQLMEDALEMLKHDQETIESLQHTINELNKAITK